MRLAKKGKIRQRRITASGPPDEVMSITPVCGPAAAGPDTAAVSCLQRAPGRSRQRAGCMVELVLELGASGHPDHSRIASVALHGFCRHRATAFELGGGSAGDSGQGVKAGTDDQLRSRARAVAPASRSPTAELHQGVGTTLPLAPEVILGRLYQSGSAARTVAPPSASSMPSMRMTPAWGSPM